MNFEQLTRGMIVEVEIPKAGEPGMHWVRAKVVGFSKGRTRVHLDFEGHDWGLALTKSDVKTRVRAVTVRQAKAAKPPVFETVIIAQPAVMDDVVEAIEQLEVQTCEACGGELHALGALGTRIHYRCRQCGLDASVVMS